jgi:hypothetical protein
MNKNVIPAVITSNTADNAAKSTFCPDTSDK